MRDLQDQPAAVAGQRNTRGVAAFGAAAAVAAAAAWLLVGAPAAHAAGGDGKATYDAMCTACHTIGGGKKAGPDLAGLASRRQLEWVRAFLTAPDKVIASGDPIAKQLVSESNGLQMPNLSLSGSQVSGLLAYLGYDGAPAAPTATKPATAVTPHAAVAGDAAKGKDIFKGGIRLANGGPACLSCHSIAGVGALGGGRLGPDLTGSYAKYGGAQGIKATLKTLPFPTMAPIFNRKPLTDAEQANLAAFLKTAPNLSRSADAAGELIGYAFAGVAALALLALGAWRGRLRGVRKPLVNRSTGK